MRSFARNGVLMISREFKVRNLLALPSAIVLCTGVACGQEMRPTPQKEIEALLYRQVEAWNQGNIEGYMEGYWQSDSTLFSGGGSMIRGFNTVLERYRKRYPTRELMGRLEFSDIAIQMLSPTIATVTGAWRLHRAGDAPGGRFTLIVQKKPEGWRITHDHTSSEQ